MNNRSPLHADSKVVYYSNTSQEDQTIVDTTAKTRSLVIKQDGMIYPKNPTNGYVSQFTDGFDGCLGHGSNQNQFRKYPRCEENH